jgi:GT2 family glycosyltransferase
MTQQSAGRATAVVILNYNGLAHLQKFLPGVVRFSPGAAVVVADNGSTDKSLEFISENFPAVQVIDIGKNLGFCGGYNYALNKIEADYFILLNNDVEVTEHWMTPLQDLLDSNAAVAAVQPKILSYHQKDHFEYAGAAGGFIDLLGYPFCRGRIFETVEVDKGQYNDTIPVFWATGACIMVRAGLFKQLGGFDEDFFAHMEEIDLCWRLKRMGHQVYYCGLSAVFHVGGGTLSVGNPRKTYFNFRNGLDILIKHTPAGQLFWKLPFRIMLDWVATVRFLAESPANGWAVLRAHGYVLTHLRKIFRKRQALKRKAGFNVGEIHNTILVWQYFVQRRKTFQ